MILPFRGLHANRELSRILCSLCIGLDNHSGEDSIPRNDHAVEQSGDCKLRLDSCSNLGFSALDTLLQRQRKFMKGGLARRCRCLLAESGCRPKAQYRALYEYPSNKHLHTLRRLTLTCQRGWALILRWEYTPGASVSLRPLTGIRLKI